jgi:hypothetical protein
MRPCGQNLVKSAGLDPVLRFGGSTPLTGTTIMTYGVLVARNTLDVEDLVRFQVG